MCVCACVCGYLIVLPSTLGRHRVSNHRQVDYLYNNLFMLMTKKTLKLRILGLLWCVFPSLSAGIPENHVITSSWVNNLSVYYYVASWWFVILLWVNSSPPCAAYKRQWNGRALVQIMAYGLFGAGLLSIGSKDKTFHSLKFIGKYQLRNGGHLVQGQIS